jgi:glycopeptide antibiotics resistance protein
MAGFRVLLDGRTANAAVAWLATLVLVLAAGAPSVAGTWLWSAFALVVVGVVVLPPILSRDPRATMPGELVALVAIPAALNATGLFQQATPFVTMAGLALMVVLVLDAFTSLEMAPRFAVLFVVVTTMAFAGAWAMVAFGADALLGTEYVGGQRSLNLQLVTATVVGLVAGVVFGAYFSETEGEAPFGRPPLAFPPQLQRSLGSDRSSEGAAAGESADGGAAASERGGAAASERGGAAASARGGAAASARGGAPASSCAEAHGTSAGDSGGPTEAGQTPDEEAADAAESHVVDEGDAEDGVEESPGIRVAIRMLQVVLVGIVGYSIVTVQGSLFVNSGVPLALTLIPAIARRQYGYPMNAGLALLIALAATLHAVGTLGPYQQTNWYDTVTHALSSTLVAGVGYAIAHSVELHTDRVSFSPRFRGSFIVLFVLAVGVLWEILEFGSELAAGYFGAEVLAQYGVGDIVKDLTFNTVGAVLVALWGTPLFRRPARKLTGSVGELFR